MSVEVPRYEFKLASEDGGNIYPYGFAQTSGELDDAVRELEAAARTDAMLRVRLADAQSAFDRNQVGDRFLALAQAGVDPRFQTSRDLGRFLLEGMARGAMTYDEPARKERLLAVVKRAVRVLNRKGDVQELWPD